MTSRKVFISFLGTGFYDEVVYDSKLTEPIFKIASIGNMLGLRVPKFILIMGNLSNDIAQQRRIEDMKKELDVADVFSLADFGTKRDPFTTIIKSLK